MMNTAVPAGIGDDAQMNLDPRRLSPRKEVVRRFYKQMWDQGETALITELFHENFTFRGSLGPVLVGHARFAEYVHWVTGTIGEYASDILALLEDGDQVAGRLRFHGLHCKPLFGRLPTGKPVWWDGMAVFSFNSDKIRDLWVLGDIYGLLGRLDGCLSENMEFGLGRDGASANMAEI